MKNCKAPELQINVTGHEEVRGHTSYIVKCTLLCVGLPDTDWRLSRRLSQFRQGLYYPVRTELGKGLYGEWFAGTPFAHRGGVPGTTARLDAWCRVLSKMLSGRQLPLQLTALVLHFLDTPKAMNLDLQVLSGSESDKDLPSDHPIEDEELSQTVTSFHTETICPSGNMPSISALAPLKPSDEAESEPPFMGLELAQSFDSLEQVCGPDVKQYLKNEGAAPTSAPFQPVALQICRQLYPSACVKVGSGLNCAEDGTASDFAVRTSGFLKSKCKEPSLSSFYEFIHFEIIPSPQGDGMHCHVAQNVFGLNDGPTGPLPLHFVLNLQLPVGPPPGPFSAAKGPSLSVVCYFRVRQETQRMALCNSSDPALRLLLNYCQGAEKNRRLQERLKLIGQVGNFSELNVPSMLQTYNGKPVLITKSGTMYSGHGYLEMDVDVKCFSFPARLALSQLWNKVSQADLTFAAVIQGDTEVELPERILGCASLHRINLHDLLDSVKLGKHEGEL